jgi:hypothetical protein
MRSVAQIRHSVDHALGVLDSESGQVSTLFEWAALGELLSKEVRKQSEKGVGERSWDRLEQLVHEFRSWNEDGYGWPSTGGR